MSEKFRWVVVLRNTETGKTFIWKNNVSATDILWRAHLYFKQIVQDHDWSKEADDYIRKYYHMHSVKQRVEICSKLLNRRVTMNAIRGRYWRLSKLSPDDVKYKTKVEPLPPTTTLKVNFNA